MRCFNCFFFVYCFHNRFVESVKTNIFWESMIFIDYLSIHSWKLISLDLCWVHFYNFVNFFYFLTVFTPGIPISLITQPWWSVKIRFSGCFLLMIFTWAITILGIRIIFYFCVEFFIIVQYHKYIIVLEITTWSKCNHILRSYSLIIIQNIFYIFNNTV